MFHYFSKASLNLKLVQNLSSYMIHIKIGLVYIYFKGRVQKNSPQLICTGTSSTLRNNHTPIPSRLYNLNNLVWGSKPRPHD